MPGQIHWRLGAMATVAVLAFAGCASSSVQMGATEFLKEHGAEMARAAAAAKAVEADASRLSSSRVPLQPDGLAREARAARRHFVRAGEWSIAEGGEEEDLPRAKTEMTEGANELAKAMSALLRYARSPIAVTLTRYEGEMARGREQWNGGISELWHLAHKSHPPTV